MNSIEYRELITKYLNGAISADQFAIEYDRTFLSDPELMDEDLFAILEDLFEDVTAYDSMWKPEDENDFRVSEKTLHEEAIDALTKLDKYLKEQ